MIATQLRVLQKEAILFNLSATIRPGVIARVMVTELSVSISFKWTSKQTHRNPTQWIFFPSSSENLAFTVPGEIFSFTGSVCGFPGATYVPRIYDLCMFELKL